MSQLGFCFEAAEDDEGTLSLLFDWHGRHPEVLCFDVAVNRQVEHGEHPEGHRKWNPQRYATMVALRNRLLDRVVSHGPDRFLSLDSDIVLEDPTTISELVRLTGSLDAVAPLTYMTPEGDQFPNVMTWLAGPGQRAVRAVPYPIGTLFRADVIMAVVMMTPPVFEQVRYEVHPQGEDLGWSAQAAVRGRHLWSASWLYAPHIMHRSMLESYVRSGDPRRPTIGTCAAV